jgi:hypothetical protein
MSKVIIYHAGAKDTFKVASATVTTGWLPGQTGTLDTTGANVKLAVTDETMFVLADDDDELNTPPTGALVTCVYGAGTKLVIDHSEEVTAGSSTRAYDTVSGNPESGTPGADLYINSDSKWTTTSTGSVKAKLYQVPAASNSYGLGVILRF